MNIYSKLKIITKNCRIAVDIFIENDDDPLLYCESKNFSEDYDTVSISYPPGLDNKCIICESEVIYSYLEAINYNFKNQHTKKESILSFHIDMFCSIHIYL